jgi:hypothetical protein
MAPSSRDDDRRHHRRFRLWLPARIEGEESQLAVGHDMSQTGSLLVTSAVLAVGDRVRIYLRIPPDDEGEEIEIAARVVRCEPNPEDPQGLWPVAVAVEFEEEAPRLERLLREHLTVVQGMSDAGEQD